MFQVPEFYHNISLKLSSVLEDVGVNERMINKRRRSMLLEETLFNIPYRLQGLNRFHHIFGSQTEVTNTPGMRSDTDNFIGDHFWNVIQNWEEWEPGLNNLFMIQDETTPPGYCMLQRLHHVQPFPLTEILEIFDVKYGRDKVLLNNTIRNRNVLFGRINNGPAGTDTGFCDLVGDLDYVIAYPFKTIPAFLRTWLQQQTQQGNLSQDMKRYIESKPCYVVPAGRKDSSFEDSQWRISTSHAERCLMFNLNVTQIQCYIMFKYLLKTYLKHPQEKGLSSFICKNLLLMCINKIHPCVWCPYNLLKIFTYCLLQLKRSISREYCPHFIIHDNNLMARKLTPEVRDWLLKRIQFLNKVHGLAFVGIKIDGLGNLLLTRLTTPSHCIVIRDFTHRAAFMSGSLLHSLARTVSDIHIDLLQEITGKNCQSCIVNTLLQFAQHADNPEQESPRLLPLSVKSMITTLQQNIQHDDNLRLEAPRLRTPNFNIMITSFLQLSQHADNFEQAGPRLLTSRFYSTISILLQFIHNGDDLEQAASRLLTPLICSSLGSVIASRDIHQDHSVSPEALTWLALGLNSDVASSRLKLASVYYCVGDFNRAEDMLNKLVDIYDQSTVEAACSCNERIGVCFLSEKFKNYANTHSELAIQHIVAFCVKFIPDEVHCQPKELQYEMFRTTREDRGYRDFRYDLWMDWAIVDSLPYLYFLQYKTCSHTQGYDKQQQALKNLALSIHTTKNLIHKETALNLLGQCYQQENRHAEALQCYIYSLNVRHTNNAAKLHICRLLYALYTQNK